MVGIAQVANSCITAAVLIANILIDSADLTSEISQGKISNFNNITDHLFGFRS